MTTSSLLTPTAVSLTVPVPPLPAGHPLRALVRTRPMVFVDCETTTAAKPLARIVDLTLLKVHPDGSRSVLSTLVNPEAPISPEATAVHGITDDMVAPAPTMAELAPAVCEFMAHCDLAGFNVERFDLPILFRELLAGGCAPPRTGAVVDVQVIYHKMAPRTLSAAVREYLGTDHDGAHGSMADALATADVLAAQLARYSELVPEPQALEALGRDPNRVDREGKFVWVGQHAVFAFGRYAGRPLNEVAGESPQFLKWILDRDFPEDVKRICKAALCGVFPQRAQA